MTRPVSFVRLPEGRLWHASAFSAWVTACGRVVDVPVVGDDDRDPEYLDGHVPAGAWVCRRCRDALADWLHAVDMAVAADPRGRRTQPLPEAVSEELAALAEEVRVSREGHPVEGAQHDELIDTFLVAADAEADRFEAHLQEVPF